MSKKQVRFQISDLHKDPDNFPRTALNYVLKNGKVILGNIQSFTDDKITIRNSFRKKIILEQADIEEIWGEVRVQSR